MYGLAIAGGIFGAAALLKIFNVIRDRSLKAKQALMPISTLPPLDGNFTPEQATASGPPSPDSLVSVFLPNGEEWLVSREYIAPVGIGEAVEIAKAQGMQLPTAALVDAIFSAADLHIDPPVRASDGTPKTMSTPAVYENQRQRIAVAIAERPFNLIAGTHKDVVILPSGKPGLYGWNVEDPIAFTRKTGVPTHTVRGASGVKVEAGPVVQQEFGGHGLDWKDYSQGVRLVRRA